MQKTKTLRSDFNIDRSKRLYEEYTTADTSYNKLAKKYKISPQRVRYLINDYKEKGLTSTLKSDAKKQIREEYKNTAVMLRETGKTEIAIQMFNEIIAWDEQNNNIKGKMDVLGYKKIALTQLADKSKLNKKRIELLQQAFECIKEAIKIGEQTKDIPEGSIAIQKVHLASLLDKEAELSQSIESEKHRLQAIKALDEAIKKFPGSEAHKSWPLSIKARILHSLGKTEEAFEIFIDCQRALYFGYEDEIKNADQAELKLRVWNAGIQIGFAKIYMDQKKYILAEVHASAVINTLDPERMLTARKQEAKEILEQCKKNS